MDSEAQFRAAQRAYDRKWSSPPEDDDSVGECPTCGGETSNGEEDVDVDVDEETGRAYGRRMWTWHECDDCAKGCDNCGEHGPRNEDGYCETCAEEIAAEEAEAGEIAEATEEGKVQDEGKTD